jgi:hypothetical protein
VQYRTLLPYLFIFLTSGNFLLGCGTNLVGTVLYGTIPTTNLCTCTYGYWMSMTGTECLWNLYLYLYLYFKHTDVGTVHTTHPSAWRDLQTFWSINHWVISMEMLLLAKIIWLDSIIKKECASQNRTLVRRPENKWGFSSGCIPYVIASRFRKSYLRSTIVFENLNFRNYLGICEMNIHLWSGILIEQVSFAPVKSKFGCRKPDVAYF